MRIELKYSYRDKYDGIKQKRNNSFLINLHIINNSGNIYFKIKSDLNVVIFI
jgi:hypothetical protein